MDAITVFATTELEKAVFYPLGGLDRVQALHLYLEASALAFADRNQCLADADFVAAPSTTHLTVSDRWGNVVSYTFTIEQIGGSGIVVPDHGFLLNNELTDFNSSRGRRTRQRAESGHGAAQPDDRAGRRQARRCARRPASRSCRAAWSRRWPSRCAAVGAARWWSSLSAWARASAPPL